MEVEFSATNDILTIQMRGIGLAGANSLFTAQSFGCKWQEFKHRVILSTNIFKIIIFSIFLKLSSCMIRDYNIII